MVNTGRGDKIRVHGGFKTIKRAVHLDTTSRLFFTDGTETVYNSTDRVEKILNVFGTSN